MRVAALILFFAGKTNAIGVIGSVDKRHERISIPSAISTGNPVQSNALGGKIEATILPLVDQSTDAFGENPFTPQVHSILNDGVLLSINRLYKRISKSPSPRCVSKFRFH